MWTTTSSGTPKLRIDAVPTIFDKKTPPRLEKIFPQRSAFTNISNTGRNDVSTSQTPLKRQQFERADNFDTQNDYSESTAGTKKKQKLNYEFPTKASKIYFNFYIHYLLNNFSCTSV